MLEVIIRVNRDEIDRICAQRLTKVPENNRYRVFRYQQTLEGFDETDIAEVTHRYSDGALVLARKILKAAIKEREK